MSKFLLTVVTLGLLLIACKQGEKVRDGKGQEYISFVEVQENGLYQVWLRYDNIASYCFDSDQLYEKANWFIDHYPDGISRIQYKGIFVGDPMYENWLEMDEGCGSFGGGSDGGGTDPLRLIDFCIMEPAKVLGEDTPREYYCETIPEYLLPPEPES